MIHQLLPYLSSGFVATSALVAFLLVQVWIRFSYHQKVKAAGGVHAAPLAKDPLTALTWLLRIGLAQAQNRLLDFFHYALSYATPESPHLVEINVTGGQRCTPLSIAN